MTIRKAIFATASVCLLITIALAAGGVPDLPMWAIGVTPGTAQASKALVLDSNSDIDILSSSNVAITAAGSTLSGATLLTKTVNVVTTGVTGSTGVRVNTLPFRRQIVMNADAAHDLLVYPNTVSQDLGAGVGVPVTLGATQSAEFVVAIIFTE